jgi:uncharacterized membrane protein
MTMLTNIKASITKPAKIIYFAIAFLVACMIILKSTDYFNPDFSHGFLSDKKEIFDKWYKYFLYMHICSAPLTIFSGILQFSLSRKTKFHRLSGYVYIVAVVFAAIGGFFMSFKSIGGIASGISFLTLSVLWIFFTVKAFTSIKSGNIPAHKRFMTRSFILANSAILLRLFSFISNSYIHVNPVTAYIFISWFIWVPWLLIYEWMKPYRIQN